MAVKLGAEDPAIRANFAAYWVGLGNFQRALEQLNTFNRLAQQIPNIDPEILSVVSALTSIVTRDMTPQRGDASGEETRPISQASGSHQSSTSTPQHLEISEQQLDTAQHYMESDEV
uniref:CCR4-NOT transcription complex subunit 10 n=1 Tax=Graphocephala atropunctata TaxID=36148 RepID=A0A1B6MRE7_9HEMI